MKVMHFSALAAIVVAMMAPMPVVAREMLTAQTLKTMCQNMMSCNKGGVEGNTCTIKTQSCPPCVTFENNGCFEFQNGQCNFGEDCKQAWEAADEPTTAPPANNNNDGTPSSGSKGNGGGAGSAGVAGNSTGGANSTTKAPSSKDAKTTDSKADSGTDMTVVFGIVGAAIGVIAVAVIFLALVRRSRAAEEDDDELAGTPPAMAKTAAGPSTTTNAASYAPYSQRAPQANPTTPTNRVIKYYNDNALPSPHGARGAGGFNQQSQQPAQVKTVRPAAAANAPTFFKPNPPTAAPLPQQARSVAAPPPVQPHQFVSQEQNYYAQATTSMPVAAQYPHAEPLFTVHTGPEEPQLVRRESSPRPRRESYEF